MNAIDIKQESRNRPHARAVGHYLAATAGRHGRYQDRAAAGLVSVERHRDAVDRHLGVALGDLAFAVAGDRTSAAIALAGDGHAHDFAFRRRRADFAAVAGGVVQTYHAAHGVLLLSLCGAVGSIWNSPANAVPR